jgi:acetoin utilization deacetylase AcuC-like enzyme
VLGPETFASFGSHGALLRAQSAWLEAVDAVLPAAAEAPGGRRVAWALTRPPGHHAGYSTAQGFCVYNFAAAACEHALEAGVDWCAHVFRRVAPRRSACADASRPFSGASC